jgi:hypothetical protein
MASTHPQSPSSVEDVPGHFVSLRGAEDLLVETYFRRRVLVAFNSIQSLFSCIYDELRRIIAAKMSQISSVHRARGFPEEHAYKKP